MTHEERFERRKQMADAVRSGKPPGDVAREACVTVATVLRACQEHGVPFSLKRQRPQQTIAATS